MTYRLIVALLIVLGLATPARAAEEFAPPTGKGRVVIMLSGQSGVESYRQIAGIVAASGYDVILLDTKSMMGTHGQALRDTIATALQGEHALPGKVGFIGFSLGGGLAIEYGPGAGGRVAGVAAGGPAAGGGAEPPT